MSDYNNRQYRLMMNHLNGFGKRMDLKRLINGLESLLGALKKPEAAWKAAFQHQ